MKFQVISNSNAVPSEGIDKGYLSTDNWNDWFKYCTLYVLTYFDKHGEKHEFGGIKIGQFNWQKDQTRPAIPAEFDMLDDRFFSLGQDTDFYVLLAKLDDDERLSILNGLKDVVADDALFRKAINEDVMGVSLLRSVDRATVEGQFRRILDGGEALTQFNFHYQGSATESMVKGPLSIHFSVKPESKPPSNIQVLIGRNGVGKTHLLNAMTRSIEVVRFV